RPIPINLNQSLHLDEIITFKSRLHVFDVVPHLCVEFTAAVSQRQSEERFPCLLCLDLLGFHQECRCDGLICLEVGNKQIFHDSLSARLGPETQSVDLRRHDNGNPLGHAS